MFITIPNYYASCPVTTARFPSYGVHEIVTEFEYERLDGSGNPVWIEKYESNNGYFVGLKFAHSTTPDTILFLYLGGGKCTHTSTRVATGISTISEIGSMINFYRTPTTTTSVYSTQYAPFYENQSNEFLVSNDTHKQIGDNIIESLGISIPDGDFYSYQNTFPSDLGRNSLPINLINDSPTINNGVISSSVPFNGLAIYFFLTKFTVTENFSITYIPINCALSGPESASEGDEITVTITPNEGYIFTGAQYVSLLTNPETPAPEFTVDENTIKFIMPADVVQVTVKCVKANPYDEGGDSSINGGGGTFDNPDDVIDGPSLPSLSAIASGFIRMYNPTQSELTDFSAWLQDSNVFTAAFRDMFGKPIESVVSLAIAPFIPPRTDEKDYVVISGTRSVGIQMYQVTRQYTEIDCGEITPKEYWGGFLDYAPFTKTSLYLPYVGYREINVNEIMEKPLKVFYHIDVFTGASVCFVMCGGNVLYHYDCNVLTNIPFGATEYNSFVSGVLNIAAQSATIAAAGTSGVGAAMIPSAATNIAASAANMVRPSFPHSGVVTANSGLLSIKTPYLILERPRQAMPKNVNHYTGFPSYVTSKLSDLSGYTKISDIHLENVPASDDELSEIETLLRNGVIL